MIVETCAPKYIYKRLGGGRRGDFCPPTPYINCSFHGNGLVGAGTPFKALKAVFIL